MNMSPNPKPITDPYEQAIFNLNVIHGGDNVDRVRDILENNKLNFDRELLATVDFGALCKAFKVVEEKARYVDLHSFSDKEDDFKIDGIVLRSSGPELELNYKKGVQPCSYREIDVPGLETDFTPSSFNCCEQLGVGVRFDRQGEILVFPLQQKTIDLLLANGYIKDTRLPVPDLNNPEVWGEQVHSAQYQKWAELSLEAGVSVDGVGM